MAGSVNSRLLSFSSYVLAHHPLNAAQLEQTSYSPFRQLNYQRASLLVVEDRDDVWTLLGFALAKTFPDVTIKRTVNRPDTVIYIQEGLAHRVSLPKLILQDLYLPDRQDGLGLLEDTRALLTHHQQPPILVLSSSVDPSDVQEVYCGGAGYYLVKPTDMSGWLSLCQAIRHFWWDQGVLPIYAPLQIDGPGLHEVSRE